MNDLLDPRVQTAIVGSLLIIAALPTFTDVRYRFTSSLPFIEAYIAEDPLLRRRRDRENFRILPLIDRAAEGENIQKPAGVARDSKGALHVSDVEENIVYKMDVNGQRSAFAGAGKPGYDGDVAI